MKFDVPAIVKKSLNPLITINGLLLMISGVWLLMSGEWVVIWMPLLGVFISPLVFPILMFPAGLFAGIMTMAERSGRTKTAKVMYFCSLGYLVLLLATYILLCFRLAAPVMGGEKLLPAAVWAVTSGVIPWMIFATNDRDNIPFTILTIMAEKAAIITILAAIFIGMSLWTAFFVFCGVMAIFLCVQRAFEKKFLTPAAPPGT
jgi:hypothetical protein